MKVCESVPRPSVSVVDHGRIRVPRARGTLGPYKSRLGDFTFEPLAVYRLPNGDGCG